MKRKKDTVIYISHIIYLKILWNPRADAMTDQWRDSFLGTNLLILGRTPGNNTRGAS